MLNFMSLPRYYGDNTKISLINPSDDFDRRQCCIARRTSKSSGTALCGKYSAFKESDVRRFIDFRQAVIGHPRAATIQLSVDQYGFTIRIGGIDKIVSFLALFCATGKTANLCLLASLLFPCASIHIRSSFVDRANRLLSSFAQIAHVSQLITRQYTVVACFLL